MADILRVPRVTLLATSREALGIAGEKAYRVPSLSAPDPAALWRNWPTARPCGFWSSGPLPPGALSIFPPRTAGRPMCRRLDGIPLAIELAAARVKVLSFEQIADRLDDRFRLLTGGSRTALPRQRTLRASIDWSYSLLPEANDCLAAAVRLLRRVDPGGSRAGVRFGLRAGKTEEILDGLAALVNKSLVATDASTGPEMRYRMLETIRQFAQESWMSRPGCRVRDPPVVLPGAGGGVRIAAALAAGRRAFERWTWSWITCARPSSGPWGGNRTGAEQAERMVCALSYFWDARALLFEAIAWIERALPRLSAEDLAGAELHAKARFTLGHLYRFPRINRDQSILNIEKSIRFYRHPSNQRSLAQALALNYAILSDGSPLTENAPTIKSKAWRSPRSYSNLIISTTVGPPPEVAIILA